MLLCFVALVHLNRDHGRVEYIHMRHTPFNNRNSVNNVLQSCDFEV